jgi:hypothetical protein
MSSQHKSNGLHEEFEEYREDANEHREMLAKNQAVIRGNVHDHDQLIDQLLERIETLEQRVDQLEENQTTGGKIEKVRKLVEFADNRRRGDQRGAVLSWKDIRDVTGVKKRYAINLADDDDGLPEEYDFIMPAEEAPQFTASKQGDGLKSIFIDVELAHQARSEVSRCITKSED